MIDLKDLRENPEKYRRGAELKNIPINIAAVLDLDGQRLRAQQDFDRLRAEQNEASKSISKLAGEEKAAAIAAMGQLKGKVEEAKGRQDEFARKLDELLVQIPQPPDEDVPVGKDAGDNVVVRTWGEPRRFEFGVKSHIELGKKLGLLDFEAGV